jgi:hypothetical protein
MKKDMVTIDVTSPSAVETNNLKEDLREMELREADLTRRKLFRVVSGALDAVKLTVNDEGGVICEEPDHEVRLKAAKEAREILGETAAKQGAQRIPAIVLILPGGARV